MKMFETGLSPLPVYFYCLRSAAESERANPAAILASIVRQLSCVRPGLPLLRPVIEKYEEKGQHFSLNGLNLDENRQLIIDLAEHYPMTTIIIDALDECESEER